MTLTSRLESDSHGNQVDSLVPYVRCVKGLFTSFLPYHNMYGEVLVDENELKAGS